MKRVDTIARVRRAFYVHGWSVKKIVRELHVSRNTVRKILQQIREGKAPNEGRDFSYSEQRQKLMTAEQITGMKADDLLLLVGNRNPLKAKQNLYFKSKAYRGRFDQNPLN